jgi:hypothetical protein
MDAVDPSEVRGVRTEDFFIRAGGVMMIHKDKEDRRSAAKTEQKYLTDSEVSEASDESDAERMEDAVENANG